MENINREYLDSIISDYYNSVEDLFKYRKRHEWKREILIFLIFISVVFLFFNILPILPYIDKDYNLPIFILFQENFDQLKNLEFNFWINWALGVIVSLLTFLIILIPVFYWKKRSKKFLQSYLLRFCYAFLLRKELKSYIINENEIHLENSLKYFRKISNPLVHLNVDNNDNETHKIHIEQLLEAVNSKTEFINFTQDSVNNIKSLSLIPEKIERRLRKNLEISKILPLIDSLTYYEFARIKPSENVGNGIKLKEYKSYFIKKFISQLNDLEILELGGEENNTNKEKISIISRFITNSFSSQNIFILFISWLIFLVIIFISISILVINILSKDIDSTILMGLLTAPFLGAITMTGIIYNKSKK